MLIYDCRVSSPRIRTVKKIAVRADGRSKRIKHRVGINFYGFKVIAY